MESPKIRDISEYIGLLCDHKALNTLYLLAKEGNIEAAWALCTTFNKSLTSIDMNCICKLADQAYEVAQRQAFPNHNNLACMGMFYLRGIGLFEQNKSTAFDMFHQAYMAAERNECFLNYEHWSQVGLNAVQEYMQYCRAHKALAHLFEDTEYLDMPADEEYVPQLVEVPAIDGPDY